MFKRLLAKKIDLVAPITGEVIELTEVSDQIFSQKIVGDGCAIIPVSGKVIAPCKAKVLQIPSSNHAIGLKLDHEVELLIHIGIDTVELRGQGFMPYVKPGDTVKQGQVLLDVDLDFLKNSEKVLETPIIITNMNQVKKININYGPAKAGETSIMRVTV